MIGNLTQRLQVIRASYSCRLVAASRPSDVVSSHRTPRDALEECHRVSVFGQRPPDAEREAVEAELVDNHECVGQEVARRNSSAHVRSSRA